MSVTNKPNLEAYIGSTGSGKGVSIKARLTELQAAGWPLIIWDPRNEYGAFAEPVNAAGLIAAGRAIKAGQVRAVRFVHDGRSKLDKAFAGVCDVAFRAGGCVFLAEELSDVTTASLAPPQWKRILTQGRHQGLYVIGAAQRPALIDKTFLGQATYIRCFNLRYHEDRVAMAKAMDVPEPRISALKTIDDDEAGRPIIKTHIRYLERDFRRDVLQEGDIHLQKRREKDKGAT
jgi:DNA helicase HerA-like ATPase